VTAGKEGAGGWQGCSEWDTWVPGNIDLKGITMLETVALLEGLKAEFSKCGAEEGGMEE